MKPMDMRRIGSLEVSVVGLGCNNFGGRLDSKSTDEVVHAAMDAGINFFDTADIYGATKSEVLLGAALGKRRDEVLVATKFGMKIDEDRHGAKPDYLRSALEDSLRRLATDHVDLYQLHAPDPQTPIAETLAALDEQVKAGKVREIGCSNFSAEQLREAQRAVREGAARFVSVQNQYNLLQREAENEVIPECERSDTAFIPYFPLASGLLTGKYRRGQPRPSGTRISAMPAERIETVLSDSNLSMIEALAGFAEDQGHSLLELAIAWLLAKGVVASVISGAMNPDQVKANARSGAWVLTEDQVTAVDRIALKS